MTLTKSQCICGRQCLKSFWLLKNGPELKSTPDYAQTSLFNTGTGIEGLARELFPGDEDGIFAMAEILVKSGDVWNMFEVKGIYQCKRQKRSERLFGLLLLGKWGPIVSLLSIH